MPLAIEAIFGASSAPLAAELRRVEAMSATAGRSITTKVASGSRSGFSAVARELTVVGRELATGQVNARTIGSFTRLFQALRDLAGHAKDAAAPARMVADAYQQMSLSASLAAVAAMRKAQASELAFMASGEESAATLNAAIADRAKAQAAEMAAVATQQKAVASGEAAAAAEAEAVATGAATGAASMLTVALGTAAITLGFIYEKYWGLKSVLASSSMPIPDLKADYVPMMKRHQADARNAQKEVTDEVNKTVTAYNSAAEAAKRVADNTKTHYDHAKKMLELQKQTKLAKASTTTGKESIEKKYAGQELQLLKDQHQEDLANKYMERANLEIGSKNKLRQAKAIVVPTREEDQSTMSRLNTNAEAAEAFLKGGGWIQEFKKQAAAAGGIGSEGRAARLEAIRLAEEGGSDAANKMIAQRNKFTDTMAARDEIRKPKADLEKKAAEEAAAAAKLGLEIPTIKKENAKSEANTAQEQAAQLAAEKAKDSGKEKTGGFALNAQQRMGAYAAMPPDLKIQTDLLRGILKNTAPVESHNPVGSHSTLHGSAWHTAWRRQ